MPLQAAGPMSLRVTIVQASVEKLHDLAALRGHDLELTASQVLMAGLDSLPTHGRAVVIDQATLQGLEAILGGGSILHQQDLTQKVHRLAGISFGHVRLDFTPGQLEEIDSRASRLSMTGEELIRRTARKMEELFFTHLGVGSQG